MKTHGVEYQFHLLPRTPMLVRRKWFNLVVLAIWLASPVSRSQPRPSGYTTPFTFNILQTSYPMSTNISCKWKPLNMWPSSGCWSANLIKLTERPLACQCLLILPSHHPPHLPLQLLFGMWSLFPNQSPHLNLSFQMSLIWIKIDVIYDT